MMLSCCECGGTFQRAGSRGPIPKWCPPCKRARQNVQYRTYKGTLHRACKDCGKAAPPLPFDKADRGARSATDPPWERSPHVRFSTETDGFAACGPHALTNVQTAHLRCNVAKGNRVEVLAK